MVIGPFFRILFASVLLAVTAHASIAPLPGQSRPPDSSPDSSFGALIPTRESFPKFIETARQRALQYVREIPDFVCTQITKRYIRTPQKTSRTGIMERESWVLEDQITEEVSYFDHKESYRLLKMDRRAGTPMSPEARRGATSTGEYASELALLFQPATRARFEMEGIEKISGRKAVRARYRVEQANSESELKYLLEGNLIQSIKVDYRGRCWLDAVSGQIVRLQMEAVDIPSDFAIALSNMSVDYGPIDIAGSTFWLPIRAETHLATSNSKDLPEHERLRESRNVIKFENYHKFGTDVKIVYPPRQP